MLLNIAERIYLLSVLPQKSSLVKMRLIKQLIDDLSFTEDEIVTHGIKETDGKIMWQSGFEKDITIPELLVEDIRHNLIDLAKNNEVTLYLLGLYDKFNIKEEEING